MNIHIKHVLITGTTSGIGRSLLEHYASRGVVVTAVNRRKDVELESRYPKVKFQQIDVRDAQAVSNLVNELARGNELPDTFILNAGINRVDNDPTFLIDEFREVVDTNLFGALNFVAPLISLKSRPSATQVIAISSMTNYAANPYCLGYYVSKRALTNSFEGLEAMYRKTDLKFKWVILGPVLTGITSSAEKFPKFMSFIKNLFSISQEETVRALVNFSEANQKQLIFPLRAFFLFQGLRLAKLLFPGFYRGKRNLETLPNVTKTQWTETVSDAKR